MNEVKFETVSRDDLKGYIIRQMETSDISGTKIGKERRDNLEYYENRGTKDIPKGNRSKVQTSDIYDHVNWLHGQIMEALYSSSVTPVEFIPIGSPNVEVAKKNIEQAKQETVTVNHVINQENEGFLVVYQWLKDALIQKNGIIKVFWDEKVQEEQESYKDLGHAEYLRIIADDNVSLKQHTYYIDGVEQETNELPPINPTFPLELQTKELAYRLQAYTHDVKFLRKNINSQVVIENVAPENFYVRRNHNSLDLTNAIFCAQVEKKTRGELINDGYDPAIVMNLASFGADYYKEESAIRYSKENANLNLDQNLNNKLAEEVEVVEAYCRCDYDGDGKLELVQAIIGGGRNGEFLSIEEVDNVPYISITPEINSYRFHGSCPADKILQIQRAKTAITRQILDNLYASNNPQKNVNLSLLDDGGVDDIKNVDIDALIRVTDQAAISYSSVPFVAAQSLPILDLFDKYAERRTGVSDMAQGLDPALLKDQSMFIGAKMLNASQQKVLFLTRTIAETGFRQLYLKVHELLTKFEKNAKILEIAGSYVEVDPRNWKKRNAVRPLVGTGNNTNETKIMALQQVLNFQKEIIANGGIGGLTDLDKVYNTLNDLVDIMGLNNVERYFNKAEPVGQQETPPDTAYLLGMEDIRARKEMKQADIQIEKYKTDQKTEVDKTKLIQDAVLEKGKQSLEKDKIELQEKKINASV